jgi:hypothetical protein
MSAEPCNWPESYCQCWAAEQGKPDPYGREWMHCEEGLAMNKASMARLMMFCLSKNVLIGEISAFNPRYRNSVVLATFRLRPDQFAAFEAETGGKLRKPPKIHLNSTTPAP